MDEPKLDGFTRASLSFYSRDDRYKEKRPYCFTGELTVAKHRLRTNQAFEDHDLRPGYRRHKGPVLRNNIAGVGGL